MRARNLLGIVVMVGLCEACSSSSPDLADARVVIVDASSHRVDGARVDASPADATPTIVDAHVDAASVSIDAAAAPVALSNVCGSPDQLVFDGTYLWVSCTSDNTLLKVDTSTRTVVDTVNVDLIPDSIMSDGTSLWVACVGSHDVVQINESTDAVVSKIQLAGASPNGIASDGTDLWVVDEANSALDKIDPITQLQLATVSLGAGTSLGLQKIVFVDQDMWVASYQQDEVIEVDPVQDAELTTLGVGASATLLFSDGENLWASAQSTVARIDPATKTVVASIDVGTAEISGAFTDGGGYIWVTLEDATGESNGPGYVAKIDPTTNTVVDTTLVGSYPSGIAYVGGEIWVANNGSNSLSVISP